MVVERAGEGDDADPGRHQARSLIDGLVGDEVVLDVHDERLDHGVGQQGLGSLVDRIQPVLGELTVDLELEPLALPD